MQEGVILLLVGAILLASLVVALGAARTGLPVLVAFLGLGMLLGSDGPGGIEFDDAELAREVGIVGLALILYEGGLQTSWRRLRQVAVPAALLSTVGVAVSAVLTGVAAHALFDSRGRSRSCSAPSFLDRCCCGLRNPAIDPHSPPAGAHARGGTGGNDPMAIALTLGLIAWIEKPEATGSRISRCSSCNSSASGSLVGIVLGVGVMLAVRSPAPPIGSFAPVASVAAAALSFGAADTMGGSGFLAVYLVGLAVGSTPSRYRESSSRSTRAWRSWRRSTLFIVLGLLVFPSQLSNVAVGGLAPRSAADA